MDRVNDGEYKKPRGGKPSRGIRYIHLNNKARIMEKEPLKSKDCENINILKEQYEIN